MNDYNPREFHDRLLSCIYSYFDKPQLIDDRKLYQMYNNFLSQYARSTLPEDWMKQIQKYHDKKLKQDNRKRYNKNDN